MEDARQACKVGVKWEIEVVDNYGKYAHLMPLYYAMLYYNIQGAVFKLSFLAKPCQPNGYNDQMVLVSPLKG